MNYPHVVFSREDTSVVATVRLDVGGGLEWAYRWKFNTGNEATAAMLASRMCEVFSDQLVKIKQNAYTQGYKDGRGRKAKRDSFCADFDADPESM